MPGELAAWIRIVVHMGVFNWDFHPTSNKEGPDSVSHIDGLTATGEVVYHLLSKLPNPGY